MRVRTLKNTLLFSFLSIIMVLGIFTGVLGFHLIQDEIVERIQKEVIANSNAAGLLYDEEIKNIAQSFQLTANIDDLDILKKAFNLDYVYEIITPQGVTSKIAQRAFAGKGVGGTRIIAQKELETIFPLKYKSFITAIKDTPKARQTTKKTLNSVMVLEYAQPIVSRNGKVIKVRYGGRVLNGNFGFIDKINDIIFLRGMYKNKPIGTVTIFQDDVRVTTNVLNNDGQRAIGTRVSDEVYHEVVEKGDSWLNRAFVVTDWYLTAYKPIKNIDGKIIGILYVGMLEKPFVDLRWNIFIVLFLVIAGTALGAGIFSYFIAHQIAKPVTNMAAAADKISQGDFSCKITKNCRIKELATLAAVFNDMTERIWQREKSLQKTNVELEKLNKSYLDLVGFVSHELKGILSSIVLNVYNLKQLLLGPLNDAQQRALYSISRNLNYLSETVKNFLNLSRIEKDEFEVRKRPILLKKDVFEEACNYFSRQAEEKNMRIINEIDEGIIVQADLNLIQVAVNNLLSNAVKYGKNGGKIIITCRVEEKMIQCEIYNDGRPIEHADLNKLFQKFSRLNYQSTVKIKGTGIGLFITKEIISRHGGSIWVEPQDNGNTFLFKIENNG